MQYFTFFLVGKPIVNGGVSTSGERNQIKLNCNKMQIVCYLFALKTAWTTIDGN